MDNEIRCAVIFSKDNGDGDVDGLVGLLRLCHTFLPASA